MPSLGNDYIGVALARLYELQIHRLDCPAVSLDYPADILTPFGNVSCHNPHQAVIVVGIDKYLQVELTAELFAGEDEYSFDYDYVCGFDKSGFGLGARTGNE